MKVVCLNVTNKISKNDLKIKERNINILNEEIVFKEVIVPLDFLNKRVFTYSKGIVGKIKGKHLDKRFKKSLKSENVEDKIYLCTNLLRTSFQNSNASGAQIKQYIDDTMQSCNFVEYKYKGNIISNTDKYINEILDRKNKKDFDTKILLAYKNILNVDITFIKDIIQKYKEVDIFVKDKNNDKIYHRINEINQELGTSITLKDNIINQNRKIGYDIIIYVDDYKKNFNELKCLSRVDSVELYNNDNDKFDNNVVSLRKHKLYKRINKDNLVYLQNNYGRLRVSSVLCKILADS